jgi:hypothetical protein
LEEGGSRSSSTRRPAISMIPIASRPRDVTLSCFGAGSWQAPRSCDWCTPNSVARLRRVRRRAPSSANPSANPELARRVAHSREKDRERANRASTSVQSISCQSAET